MVAGESSRRPDPMLAGLAPGTVVSGYRVESRIGAGGMAVVFRARDESLGRLVALKVLAPALAGDQEFRERFVRESRAAAAVDHPHIIPVYSAGESDGVLYLAMRYVSSGDLRAVSSREGPLSGERAVSLLSPIASALDAAHAAGLIHRDVKLANILIDTSPGGPDHPYLSDFGLAKGSAASRGLTGTGQFLGTPDYSAPEQIAGQRVGPGADQYALACVAYTMLTGQLPFDRDGAISVLWAHMNEPPPSVTARRPGLPSAVDQVLAMALAKAPEDRFPTCGVFAEALRGALGAGSYAVPAAGFPGSFPAAGGQPQPDPAGPAARPAAAPSSAPSASARPPWKQARSSSRGPSWFPAAPAATPGFAQQPTGTMNARSSVPGTATQPPGFGAPHGATAPHAAFPGGDRAVTPAAPATRGRRRTWIFAAAGVAAVAGTAAGVLVALPRTPAPVLTPTGLTATDETASAVDIRWQSPATGPPPDSYEILVNGTEIGSVPGDTTTYRASGLVPASPYDFTVIAVRGGKRSPVSAGLAARTAPPPLSAAVLNWNDSVTETMTSVSQPSYKLDKQPGETWQDSWLAVPACSSGPCDVRLQGTYEGLAFTMTLSRSGASYSGSTALDTFFKCDGLPSPGTLSISLTVSAAHAEGTVWAASAFSGSEQLSNPPGSCSGDTIEDTLKSG